jgi:hypothetical protein
LIGCGREERSAWVAEEWIPGTTSLADREPGSRWTSAELRALLLHFAAALAAMHEAGLVHGRLTLSNLRFTRGGGRIGQGWLTGAGTSWLLHPGSPRLPAGLAPEIAAGESPTPRSDVYELGASFLALGTAAGATGATAAPTEELHALLTSLVATNPAERPADGQAVLERARALPARGARSTSRRPASGPVAAWLAQTPVARARERYAALELVQRASRGETHALEVRGPSDSGKTAFLAEVSAAARRRGFATLALDLRSGTTSDPEQALIDAIDRALGWESSIAPGPDSEKSAALPEQRHAQITARLGEALDATGNRICVVLDPAVGSALECLPLLRHLASEIGRRPFLTVVGTIEPGLFPLAELIELRPFEERAVRQLLAPLLAQCAAPPDFVPALQEAAGGRPLAIRLTLEAWLASGQLDVGSDRLTYRPSEPQATPKPASEIDLLVTAALARMDPRALEWAELLALWDGTMPAPIAAQLWPEREPELPDWLAARTARGEITLVSECGRAALRARMSPERQAAGHHRLLAAIGLDPGARAAFAAQAIGAGEAHVGAVAALAAARAARAAQRGPVALKHYRQALGAAQTARHAIDVTAAAHEALVLAVALGEWGSALDALAAIDAAGEIARQPEALQFELLLYRSQVMREARRIDQAEMACAQAGRLAQKSTALEPAAAGRVELEAAAVDFFAQRPAAGIQRLDQVLPQLIAAGREDLQAVALHRRAILQSQAGETRPALRSAIAAIRAARAVAEPEINLRALTSAAFLACLVGRSSPALRLLAQARAILAQSPHTALQVTELVHRAEALAAQGAFAAAEEALLEARRLRLRSSGRSRLPAILILLGSVRFRSGRLAAAAQAYEEAIALSEELLLPEVHSARGNLGTLLVRIGERREGERLIRLGLADPRPDRRALGLLNLAQCLRQTGRLDEAALAIDEAIAELTAKNPAAARRARGERARLRHAAGDSRGAKAELRALGAPSRDPEVAAEEQLTIALAEAALGNDAGPAFAQAVALAHHAFDPTSRAEVLLEALAWANTAAASEDRGELIRSWLTELATAAAATDAPMPRAWLTVGMAAGRSDLRDAATRTLGRRLNALATEGGQDSFAARLQRALAPFGAEAGALIVALDVRPGSEIGGHPHAAGESPARAPSRPALKPYRAALRDFDRELFRAALERTGYQVPAAARLLRLPESTFRYRAGKAGAWRSRASESKPDSEPKPDP